MGYGALYSNTTGNDNAAFGYDALVYNTTGLSNAAMGAYSLYNNTSGTANAAMGVAALYYNTVGSNNTSVGVWSGPNSGALGGTITVGYTATATISNRAVIGTVTNNNLTGGYGAWQNLSDARFKRQVKEDVPGLAFITKLRPVTYTLDARAVDTFLGIAQRMDTIPDTAAKARYNQRLADVSTEVQTGFIAQEVEAAAQSIGYDFAGVHHPVSDADHYTIGYESFVMPLVKAVQELSAQLEEVLGVNAALLSRLAKLEGSK